MRPSIAEGFWAERSLKSFNMHSISDESVSSPPHLVVQYAVKRS